MADNFFGFDTKFPSGNVLGRKVVDDEFLTADVEEEEYDALNDETFGHAANDDWEEAHEKLSELIKKNDLGGNSAFHDSLLENDESQNEIVSRSISQLGLEDDLDDPAIMTIARNCKITAPMRFYRSSSPPPPAILETEDCGSPKTHSIWSTTPKDSGISSFLKSINHSSSSVSHKDQPSHKSASDNVFMTPPKAWRAEELEKDLLSSAKTEPPGLSGSWPQVPLNNQHATRESQPLSPRLPNSLGQNRNKIAVNGVLTREEVERQMHADMRMRFPGSVSNYPTSPVMPPPGLMSPIGLPMTNHVNVPKQSSPLVPLRPQFRQFSANNPQYLISQSPRPQKPQYIINSNPQINFIQNRLPMRGPNFIPGFNSSNMNINSKILSLPPRSIAHPFLHKQFQFPMVVYNNTYFENEEQNAYQDNEDEYAGLMSQREKEWLMKIQLLQLKSENPYVEDYYYTSQVTRQCQKKFSENAKKGDAPELILPETSKHDNRTFVPTQFEGSLGKLQAVSVNFPRKVLDITVTRSLEDDESKAVSNQSLMRYRKLLLDIERMYRCFLEIEDEERRILAKPESESGQHLLNIAKLKTDIYNSLLGDHSVEDYFLSILTVRKGRALVMRVFKIFSLEQQLQCLISLLRHLILVLKRDQIDLVLMQYIDVVTDTIQKLTIPDLLKIGESLVPGLVAKDKNGCNTTVFDFKFGSSFVFSMVQHAETLLGNSEANMSDLQVSWSNVINNIVDCLCLSKSPLAPTTSSGSLLSHFRRYSTEKSKLDVVQKCLTGLEVHMECESKDSV